jgi:arylsulfatase
MPKKIVFGALAAALAGSLFVWVITSGWLPSKLRAQERPADKTHLSGAQALPVPDPTFKGVIDRKAKYSKPDFPQAVTAPNVLLILTDDTGFGASSTFGGPIPTPAFDRVAQNGMRFNNFHTTDCARLRGRLC